MLFRSPTGSFNGDQATVSVATNNKVTCTYTNRKRAQITIVKQCNPTPDSQEFQFQANTVDVKQAPYNLAAYPSCAQGAASSQLLIKTWDAAKFINYTISESFPSTWQATSASCTANEGSLGATGVPDAPGDASADSQSAPVFHLDAGDDVTCTFVNTKKAKITVTKACNPGTDTTTPFTFLINRADVQTPTQFQIKCGETIDVVGPTAAPVDLGKV